MSEFKFSCGQCNQHIAVDEAWSGHQIKCPGCQTDIVVPPNPNRSAPPPVLPAGGSRPAIPPAAAPSPQPQRPAAPKGPAPVKFWVLALVSPALMLLVLPLTFVGIMVTKSWLGGLISLAACLPALLCGRSAIDERNSRAGVKASQMSGVGAVFAWTGVALSCLWLILTLIGFCRFTYYKVTGTTPPKSVFSTASASSRSSTVELSTPRTTPATSGSNRPSHPADPPVTTDPQSVTIPDGVPAGTLLGAPFTCTSIRYSPTTGVLDIDQGAAANPQAYVKLFLFNNRVPLAGKSFVVAPDVSTEAMRPNIHMKGANGKADAVASGYVLRLEFSEPNAKGILTGRFYLELSQSYQTKLSGTFKLEAR
jgi:hypothetical protein